MTMRKISFGIMVDGPDLQLWQMRCIEELLRMPEVELSLFIVSDEARPEGMRSLFSEVPPGNLLFALYCRLFLRPDAARNIRWHNRFSDVPRLFCSPSNHEPGSIYLSDTDVDTIQAHDLDFILHFGFGTLHGEALTAARHGIWSFSQDNERRNQGALGAFWPICSNDPVSGIVLQRLTDRGTDSIVLRRADIRTRQTSVSANLTGLLSAAAHLPSQVCQNLRTDGDDYLEEQSSADAAPARNCPGNARMLGFLFQLMWNRLRAIVRPLIYYEKWAIGLIRAPIASLLNSETPSIEWLPVGIENGYAADPFIALSPEGGSPLILFEDFDYATWRGALSAVSLDGTKTAPPSVQILSLPGHLSYPYLFRENGILYCLPENSEGREIALYRVAPDTGNLSRVSTIMADVAALDSTIVKFDDRWWLFYTDRSEGSSDRLFIRFADTLEGPWDPHPQNPVKIDVRSSRPAGTPFVKDGVLYRPAQDCAGSYGACVRIQRVIRLTTHSFAETECAVIAPDPHGPFPHGLHTLSGEGNLTVVDGKRESFIWHAFVGSTRRRIASIVTRLRNRRPSQPAPNPTPTSTFH